MRHLAYRGTAILLVMLFGAALTRAASLTATTFTYQGVLNQASAPASGNFDFKFGLYTAASGGSQVGTTVTLSATKVDKGRFTANLDFGAAAFGDGSVRWLQIDVRPSNSGSYSALAPLQPLTAAPNAIHAQSAQTAASVPWSALTGAPNTAYTPGAGLQMSSNQFSVIYGGSGSANSAARSDHNHGSTYLTPAGGDLRYLPQAGPASISSSSTLPVFNVVQTGSKKGTIGLRGQALGMGVNTAGIQGIAISTSSMANFSFFPPAGLRGESSTGWGAMGASDSGFGLFGISRDNFGVYGQSAALNPMVYGGYFGGPSGVYGNSSNPLGYAGYFSTVGNNGKALYAAGSTTITQNLNVGGTLSVTNNTNLPHALSAQTTSSLINASAIYAFTQKKSSDMTPYYWAGIRGESTTGFGVFGLSDAKMGVAGVSTTGYGVYAQSASGAALGTYSGNGWGGIFDSSAGKALMANGSVTVTQNLYASKVVYNAPRQHSLSVPASALTPYYGVPYTNDGTSGGVYQTGGSGTGFFTAPVNLPEGAVLKNITGFYYRNAATAAGLNLFLYRLDMQTGIVLGYPTTSTNTSSGYFSLSVAIPDNADARIDNSHYSYFVGLTSSAWSGNTVRLMGARVDYTIGEVN